MRIVQEAMTNVLKHSQATRLELSARHQREGESSRVEIRITDNGRGFNAEITPTGRGLGNQQYRAALIGATLQIHAGKGECQGVSVHLSIPVQG